MVHVLYHRSPEAQSWPHSMLDSVYANSLLVPDSLAKYVHQSWQLRVADLKLFHVAKQETRVFLSVHQPRILVSAISQYWMNRFHLVTGCTFVLLSSFSCCWRDISRQNLCNTDFIWWNNAFGDTAYPSWWPWPHYKVTCFKFVCSLCIVNGFWVSSINKSL